MRISTGLIMKIFKLIIGCLLLTSAVQADGFGFSLGPFSLQFNVGERVYDNTYRDILDNPICYAISHLNRLEMIVEGSEKVSAKELKFITKKLIVEPYAFGVTREGKPVLRGNVIEDKLIKEVTVKYGEEQFDDDDLETDGKKKSFFSGWFQSDKSQNIDIRKVSNIHVVVDSHFDAPKKYKGLKDDNIRVICELPIAEGK